MLGNELGADNLDILLISYAKKFSALVFIVGLAYLEFYLILNIPLLLKIFSVSDIYHMI